MDVAEALRELGKDRLVLAIHDASFPASPGEDLGRGSPHSRRGCALLRFARSLGFDGIQLGPQGATSLGCPSPYDSSYFEGNELSIALGTLVDGTLLGGLLSADSLRAAADARPAGDGRVRLDHAWRAQHALLAQAHAAFRRALAAGGALGEAYGRFVLESAARRSRAPSEPSRPEGDDARSFFDFVLAEQHLELRSLCRSLGLRLYGDLQIGCSATDREAYRALYLPGYRLGAPPSRSNPAGQPWEYPVLDPRRYDHGGRDLLLARIDHMLARYDGIRLDHPHGLVCPWVYRESDAPERAILEGARLLCSPGLADHPELAPLAIARPDQIDATVPRYANGRVRTLDDEQVRRYGALLDPVMARLRSAGLASADIGCEVLSTLPYPLGRVLERHGLGRMRVAQKASLDDPADPCRTDSARPEDWILAGTHDTPPMRMVFERWRLEGQIERRAEDLARRLVPAGERPAFARRLAEDAGELLHAFFADVFASRAGRVSIFWTDLLGVAEVYNEPGTFHERNWTLRAPADFEGAYAAAVVRGEALDLGRAIEMALRARRLGDAPGAAPVSREAASPA